MHIVSHPIVHGHKQCGETLGLSKVGVKSLIKSKEDTLTNLVIWKIKVSMQFNVYTQTVSYCTLWSKVVNIIAMYVNIIAHKDTDNNYLYIIST